MRRVGLYAALLLALLSWCASSAFAGSVSMALTGVGGNNAGGVYTYPYYLSVNGATSVSMICDTYDNEITVGETWKATESSLLDDKGLFGKQLLDYKAAGLIFKSILAGTVSVNAGNYAIWGLFSANARNNPYFQSSGAGTIESEYLAMAATAPNSAFRGLVLYTPIPGTQSSGGTAQEFMAFSPVPEPTTLALFGTGLFSLFGMVRRRKAVRIAMKDRQI